LPWPANRPITGIAGLALILLPAIACNGCAGGRSDALLPVAGQVTEEGKPLARGTISLRPDLEKGNKSQDHPTGTIGAGGRYVLFTSGREGAPAGAYKVVVFCNEPVEIKGKAHPGMPKSLIHERYNQPNTTPLSVEVKVDAPAAAYNFDLKE
jgi:hypothetical protein